MTLAEAKSTVRTVRRHYFVASMLRGLTVGFLGLIALATLLQTEAIVQSDRWWSLAMLVAILWVTLSAFSARQIRAANQASLHISAGHLDLAERELKEVLRSFSVHRASKLLVCHNLAVVVHGRKDYSAAAELCSGLISLRGGLSRSLRRMSRILLADCRLAQGDARAAGEALDTLTVEDSELNLSERLVLLPIELRCQFGQGAMAEMVSSLEVKVKLAELLDSSKAALAHALLAVACDREGRSGPAGYLRRRARLYRDPEDLLREYESLRDSFMSDRSADNNAGGAPQRPQE